MKVAFFNVPTAGHVDPSLHLAAELVSRGHQVLYVLTPPYRQRVVASGATFLETPGIHEDYFDEVSRHFNPMRLATQLLITTRDLLPWLQQQLDEYQPDAILYDSMCPWGRYAASLHGVPAVASMSLLEVPSSYLLKSGEAGRALKLVPRLLSWLGRYRSVARQLQRHYPVKIPAFPGVLNWSGDLNIIYTSAQIHPEASRPNSRHIFIGPPLPGTPEKSDFPFDKLDDSRPLIYVSLGTVFNDNPTFFRQCIEAFGGSGYQVVMSLGSRLSPALLGEVPANFLVVPYVPQVEILKRAALFITHGGVNSVHQALYFGVPLLFVPQQLEQALVATRIAELGAGKVLRKITAPALRETAEHIRDKPGFGERAAALGMGLRAAGGVAKAVDEIEALVAGGRHT